jgi:hypothetical protein
VFFFLKTGAPKLLESLLNSIDFLGTEGGIVGVKAELLRFVGCLCDK